MTSDRAKTEPSRVSRWRAVAESCGIAAVVSLVVSGIISSFIGYQFSVKLEREKEQVANLVRYKDQIDASQNNIIAQLGIYTNRLFKDKESADVEDLQKSIITAQLQINRMRGQLGAQDQQILTEYENELGNLLKSVRTVSSPNDLGPVLASAQKILVIHDKFSERTRDNIKAIF